MTFGDRLKEKLSEAGMTAAELARRSGVTKQNISRILNNTPHSITGALPTVERSTVERLAKGLGWNLDEALFAAGYAPHAAMTKPTTIEELAEALESLGIEMPLFHKVEDIDGEGFAEVLDRIRMDMELVTRRLAKGYGRMTIRDMAISDVADDNDENALTQFKQKRG